LWSEKKGGRWQAVGLWAAGPKTVTIGYSNQRSAWRGIIGEQEPEEYYFISGFDSGIILELGDFSKES
jgi:hypothetical protein